MRVAGGILIALALVSAEMVKARTPEQKSIDIQRGRERRVKTRGEKVYYTNVFDLSGLPKYAPERNPDEYLNCDVKANINTDGLPKDREELRGKLHRFMQRLAKLPERIASYFEHKYIAYAAVPELTPT